MLKIIKPLYGYRNFIFGSVKRDFQSRYKRSVLGILWLLLQPLAMIFIYTFVFSNVMQARLPGSSGSYSYSIYLCAGIIPWSFFTEVIARSQSMFIDNSTLLKKLHFPKICLPAIVSMTSTLNFVIIFMFFILFLILTNSFPGLRILLIIPVLLVQLVFSQSLGIIIGTLNVFFRDVGQIMSVIIQLWFWATPIVYTIEIVPAWAAQYLRMNPMTIMVNFYQDILVNGVIPNFFDLIPLFALTLVLAAVALIIFRRLSDEIMDEL